MQEIKPVKKVKMTMYFTAEYFFNSDDEKYIREGIYDEINKNHKGFKITKIKFNKMDKKKMKKIILLDEMNNTDLWEKLMEAKG